MRESTTHSGYQKWPALGAFLALAFAVSWVGSAITLPEIPGWYAGLAKPSFNPPPWVFGPVWATLYLLMSVAAWRVWIVNHPDKRSALFWYFVQLALNALWSPAFFGWHNPPLALAIVIALFLAVAVTIVQFSKIDRAAAWMLAPYIVWVGFATLLNASIVVLN